MIDNINDIQSGMMVKLRNGAVCFVKRESDGDVLLYNVVTGYPFIKSLDHYNELTFDYSYCKDYDIMQVFESPMYYDWYESCERPYPHLVSPVVWERPKDEKKDTEERINEIFKEIGKLVEEYEKLRG